ncbi:pollen-specific protein C13-like [Dioscorea cayenensis subsp. rotundata]|uniref:Pollen-specific protein C13-like n=1 Tax=Dioscorea cayennensis subsp. rotundata TaxID=55577 RepID=A0AB40CAN7_DIOCR|nr:pollen-specific protein C13-like [Dioscorea cayenensis subsp. rotundata]
MSLHWKNLFNKMNTFQSLKTPFMAMCLLLAMITVPAMSREMPIEFSSGELARIAGYGEERLSSVLVVGTLVCQPCSSPASDPFASPISGAKIRVGCKHEGKKKMEWIDGSTDEYGEFMVDIPSHLHAIPRLEDACKVRVFNVPKSSRCGNPNAMKRKAPKEIKLSSVGNSIRVYTAGTLKLNHGSSTKLRY